MESGGSHVPADIMVGTTFQLADDCTLCSPSWLRSSSAAHTHKETATIVHRHTRRQQPSCTDTQGDSNHRAQTR